MRSAFHEAAYTKGRAQSQGRQAAGLNALLGGMALALSLSLLILFLFYDRFWWPADEGAYAHVALRIANGEVLNRDVQDIHAGYVNLVNALAMAVFGPDLVSLRYPLFALSTAQAALAYLLLAPRGPAPAMIGAVALTALSFVQFLNPTAHWYALAIAVAIVAVLSWTKNDTLLRAEAIGFLLITLFLFRQLTGVLVAIGVIAWLIIESEPARRRGHSWLGGLVCVTMLIGLGAFLIRSTDALGWLLMGAWPVALLIVCALRAQTDNRSAVSLAAGLVRGGFVAAAPLLAYHIINGSLDTWLDDMAGAAIALSEMPYLRRPLYSIMLLKSLSNIAALGDVATVMNGVFWIALMMLPVANGLAAIKSLVVRGHVHPLPFIATFYALVSLYNQIPIYLFFSSGLSIVAFLWTCSEDTSWRRHTALGLSVLLIAVGLHYQAGQTLARGLGGILNGERIEAVTSDLPGASLKIPANETAEYRRLLDLVDRETTPDDTIFAVPFDPQLYVLSGRRNPFRFYNTAIGIRSEADLRLALLRLTRNPPTLLFYRPNDKYNTDLSARLMGGLRISYELIEGHGELEVYRLRDGNRAPMLRSN